ncbi:DUF1835 domain-containing protein [Paenibacillus piscarius]|uniref:DUF1835 domain-containing protein n=1 Tax=Paenibacillus piscarius TaxID=1089681 RepID=UPI001EE796A7|nr:DUF1835 domain-containing protein [Paenibacillus piscarius]
MLAIKKAVSTLRDEEVKPYLTQILAGIGELKEQYGQLDQPLEDHMAEPVAGLIEQYSSLMSLPEQRAFWDPAPDSNHIHILSGDSFGGSMIHALKGLGWTDTHKLIILRENYAIGPLGQLDTPEGRKLRNDWFRRHIHEYFTVSDECEREYRELLDNLEQIPEQAKIVIWTSGNACEQTGLRHIAHLLENRPNEIIVCDACTICEELFNRPDVFINYYHSGEIPADKLREALLRMDEGSRLDAAEIARLSREWQQIAEHSGALRIWQDDAVLEVPADYYDGYLLEKLDSLQPPPGDDGFLKSARLVGEALGYCEQYVGDAYFEHRVRELVYSGVLEIKGVPAAMRFYSIRRKQG